MVLGIDNALFTSIIAASILAVISLYHLHIYLERRKYEKETYNLYFSLFVLCMLIYNSIITLIDRIPAMNMWNFSGVEGLLILVILYSMIKFLSGILEYPDKGKWFFTYVYASASVGILVTLTYFINPDLYIDFFYIIAVIIVVINCTIILSVFSYWVYKKKLLQKRHVRIVYSGIVILALNVITFRLYLVFEYRSLYYIGNIIICFSVLIFAYALSVKFNAEYEELETLKNDLEKKVTERTEDLLDAKKEVELASEQKTNFFINLAHETKTPLTLISNYLKSFIKKYGKNKEISIISHNVAKLQQDMLNFLDSEKLAKNFNLFNHEQLTDISALVRTKLILFDDYAKNRGVRIHSEIKPDLYSKTDPRAIDRIINNLLENAVKYSGTGDTVTCHVNKNKEFIDIAIKDTGCGIPLDEQQNLFKPYYQMSTKKLNSQGLGIGLFLTKKILETLHVDIHIESAPGEGTSVQFSLPCLSIKDKQTVSYDVDDTSLHWYEDIKEPIPEFDPNKKLVLIAEDNKELLDYLRSELSAYYNVRTAQNGIEVIKLLEKSGNPDLIVSDIMMDKMDGHELMEFLQSSQRYNSIPIIFLTAKTSKESELQAVKEGVVDYIRKPFELDELIVKISTVLGYVVKIKRTQIHNATTTALQGKESYEPSFEQNCRRYYLTSRQIEITALILKGDKYQLIADKLNLSHRTVIRHVQNIYQKMGINNKVQLYAQLNRPESA